MESTIIYQLGYAQGKAAAQKTLDATKNRSMIHGIGGQICINPNCDYLNCRFEPLAAKSKAEIPTVPVSTVNTTDTTSTVNTVNTVNTVSVANNQIKMAELRAKMDQIRAEKEASELKVRTVQDRMTLLDESFNNIAIAENDILGALNDIQFLADISGDISNDISSDSSDLSEESEEPESNSYPLSKFKEDKYSDYKDIFGKCPVKKAAAELTIFTEANENMFFLPFVASFARKMRARGNIYAELILQREEIVEPFSGANYDAMKLSALYYFKIYFREDINAESSDIVFITRVRGRKVEFARIKFSDYYLHSCRNNEDMTEYSEDSEVIIAFAGVEFCGIVIQ